MKAFAGTFGEKEAAHLLRRTTFHPRPGDVDRAMAAGLSATVEGLLGGTEPSAQPQAELIERSVGQSNSRESLAGAWLYRLTTTTEPLRERLVLLLHNHFVSALSKVLEGRLMCQQLECFRALGLSEFSALTEAMTRDPAMIRYLDLERSTLSAPNENFARELFELFTLGPGPYTEHDIQEAARALTGLHIDNGRFHFSKPSFDAREKTILGTTGPFGAKDVVKICTSHPACARFMARKFALAFVTDTPDASLVERVSKVWTKEAGHVGRVLRRLLTSDAFFDPAHRGRVTRSPAELVVAAVLATGASLAPVDLDHHVLAMGQTLLDPPTVKGYPGGRAWLNPATWLARREFLIAAARGQTVFGPERPLTSVGDIQREWKHLVASPLEPAVVATFARLFAKTPGPPPSHVLAMILCHPSFQRC